MKKFEINVSQKYNYYIKRGSLDELGNMLKENFGSCSVIVVTDDMVDSIYGNRVAVSLTNAGFKTISYVFERGEQSKNFFVLNDLLEFMAENYITKSEARELGWEGGSVENYQDGAAIGGDRFGNREGLLPDGSWIECDIDTEDENSRGAKRLVFNLEDGLYYFTDDHYESFVEVVVDENGEIVYKE